MNRPYISKTAAQLVEAYCFEHGRTNQEDKETTQRLINEELQHRFNTMLKLMECDECAAEPEKIYEYFTHDYARR